MKKGNPFTLTFGVHPSEYISRMESTRTIVDTFDADHAVSQAYLIQGIRGSGKTVLLTTIADEFREKKDWVVIDLNSTQELLADFAMRLSEECRANKSLLPTGFNISIAGFGIGIEQANNVHDSIGIINQLLTGLKKKNKKVLITIDEVMHDDNMRTFASEFQLFIRKGFPLHLLMTGLFENINAVQNDPALTFLLRTPKITTDPLGLLQITHQYESTFGIEQEDACKLAKLTKGYAFAFQALGFLYYEYREKENLDQILRRLDELLDEYVYRKIWSSLSMKDKNVLTSISEERTKVSDICERTGMSSQTFNTYRDRLRKKGLIQTESHGFVEMTLPRFYEVIHLY